MIEVLFTADIVKPPGMTDTEFYEIWREESVVGVAGLESGEIAHLWKTAGKYGVVGVFELPDSDEIGAMDALDTMIHAVPIFAMGHHELVQNAQIIPLRSYRNWARDLEKLAKKA